MKTARRRRIFPYRDLTESTSLGHDTTGALVTREGVRNEPGTAQLPLIETAGGISGGTRTSTDEIELEGNHGRDEHLAEEHASFRSVLSRFPSGVTVITTQDESGPAGFTCQAFFSLSLRPGLVAFAAASDSRTLRRIRRSGSFAVNVLSHDQESLAHGFASKAGEKFDGIPWHPGALCPILEGALAWVECTLERVHDGGDHALGIGRVVQMGATDGRPLVYFRGGYGTFGRTGVPEPGFAEPDSPSGAPAQ